MSPFQVGEPNACSRRALAEDDELVVVELVLSLASYVVDNKRLESDGFLRI